MKLAAERQKRETREKEVRNGRRREKRLQASLEELEDQLRDSKACEAAAATELSEARTHLDGFRTENTLLQSALATSQLAASAAGWARHQAEVTAQDVLSKARAELHAVQHAVARAVADAETARQEAARAIADAAGARHDTAAARAEAVRAQEATAAAHVQGAFVQSQLDSCAIALQKSMHDQAVQVQTLSAEVTYLKTRIAEVQAQGMQALEEERARHESALADVNTWAERALADAKARAEKTISDIEQRYRGALCDADTYLDQIRTLVASHSSSEEARLQLQAVLEASEARLFVRAKALERKNDALRKRLERLPGRHARSHTDGEVTSDLVLQLKDKGVVPDHIRMLVRGLVAQGLKFTQVKGALFTVAQAIGVPVEGDISNRTIRRIVGEGWVLAVMQLVQEIKDAEGDIRP